MYHTNDTVLIIGIGNELRSDDTAGLDASRKLKKLKLRNVNVVESDGDGTKLIELWSGYRNVIVIDAVATGNIPHPGAIHKIDTKRHKKLLEQFSFSTHTFSIVQAIKLSTSLGNLPENFFIYGIEGSNFSYGDRMKPEVESSVIDAVSLVQNKVLNLQRNVKEKLPNG